MTTTLTLAILNFKDVFTVETDANLMIEEEKETILLVMHRMQDKDNMWYIDNGAKTIYVEIKTSSWRFMNQLEECHL